jgi:hypothetical protein
VRSLRACAVCVADRGSLDGWSCAVCAAFGELGINRGRSRPLHPDMQRFLVFKANTVVTCATARSFETGAGYKYLLCKFGTDKAEARAATYATIDLDLIATPMHSGVCFEEDNSNLYCTIATAVGEGKLGAFIDAFRETADGHGAYLALTNACCSPNLATSHSETCKQVLCNLQWGTGMDLEAYIRTTLQQHALIADNANEASPFTDRDKALFFRCGLSVNERYRSVIITMLATTSYEDACEAIRTAVMHDTELNRNGRAADNRTINRLRGSISTLSPQWCQNRKGIQAPKIRHPAPQWRILTRRY